MNLNITIVSVDVSIQVSAKGTEMPRMEVTFKNNANGKVDAKKIMEFAMPNAFKVLAKAVKGEVYDIGTEIQTGKDGKDYRIWTSATPGVMASISAPVYVGNAKQPPLTTAVVPTYAGKTTSTYETPEERAKKQIYIVRQSSISSAIDFYKGHEDGFDVQDVLETAKRFEDYVFGTGQVEPSDAVIAKANKKLKEISAPSFADMDEDLPV